MSNKYQNGYNHDKDDFGNNNGSIGWNEGLSWNGNGKLREEFGPVGTINLATMELGQLNDIRAAFRQEGQEADVMRSALGQQNAQSLLPSEYDGFSIEEIREELDAMSDQEILDLADQVAENAVIARKEAHNAAIAEQTAGMDGLAGDINAEAGRQGMIADIMKSM